MTIKGVGSLCLSGLQELRLPTPFVSANPQRTETVCLGLSLGAALLEGLLNILIVLVSGKSEHIFEYAVCVALTGHLWHMTINLAKEVPLA